MENQIEVIENMLKIGNFNKMYRINYNGIRIYIQDEPFAYYSGLTAALSASRFNGDLDGKVLKNWRESMISQFDKKTVDNYVDLTADFGTLLHMAIVTIKEKGQICWGEEKDKAYSYFIDCYKEKGMIPNSGVLKKMAYEYQKHVASLLQFVYERVHEIYAVETPAKIEDLKIATPIDIFCSCRQTEKGEFKKTTINTKTASQISNHMLEQICCEFMMWNETYSDAECTAILRTKDWNECKAPTYEYKYLLKDHAEQNFTEIRQRLSLCLKSKASYLQSPSRSEFTGITKIGEQPVIEVKTLQESWDLMKNELNEQ